MERFPSPAVALDDLLAGLARGLATAQGQLDTAAHETREQTAKAGATEVHLRPLWFVFERTTVDVEFSTFVASHEKNGAHFTCRPVDAVALALRGDAQAHGARLHVEIVPRGADVLRAKEE